ncbi:MAG TPA: GMC family oxidoreductase N-terminal domain-containing protein, partial [Minicystis sp.]|nr:GMC family oxidoreductase N-terminal domain-containing protein [Minicystis sp.]
PDYPDARALPKDLRDGSRNSWLEHDWRYSHRPTPTQRVPFVFPRGKVVGGSSAVNTCIALRGHPYDYDEWAARGLPEWTFERCLPAFRRLEDDRDFGDQPYHGRGGPIPIRRHTPSEWAPWQAAFVEACRELGHRDFDDANEPGTRGGVGPHAMNKIDGVRMSAARGYLGPDVRRRDNLEILPEAVVRRVVVKNGVARGVEVERRGEVETIAARAVVLAAGAIATPGILLRSGIGPRDEVARLGVELVADVPAVGARLLDHPGAAIILAPRRGVSRLSDPLIQTVLRYTSASSAEPLDMQIQPGSFLPLHPRLVLPAFTMMCCVGKPRGHGSLRFTSADPHDKPVIDSRFLLDAEDRARAVEALTMTYALLRTRAMQGLAHYFWPDRGTLADPERLREWILKSTGSGYHPCGTVPMGPEGAADAAVDGRGRVRGVAGLVVADASIMPTVPSANTNLSTLMIGERFGAWLRDGEIV